MASPARQPAHPAQRKVTVIDVARAAGVGKSTVSNVLNGSGRVGPAARVRVLQAVDQLGYHPHHGARSMRARRTMQLAYLMAPVQLQPTNLIMMQFLQSLLKAAADRGYGVLVVAQQANPGEDIRRLVTGRMVDAFVLSELQPGDRRVERLHALGMPFACMGRTDRGLPQHWVDFDNAEAEAEAVRYVLDQGFTRPGYIGYASSNYWDGEREAGSGPAWPAAAFPARPPTCSASRRPARAPESAPSCHRRNQTRCLLAVTGSRPSSTAWRPSST